MATDLPNEKLQAHQLIERLRPDQLSAVVSLLQFMLLDPVSRAIATAPADDEPEGEEEHQAVAESRAWFEKHGKGIPHEQIAKELGM